MEALNRKLTQQTDKYLQRLARQDIRIRRMLSRMDSSATGKTVRGDSIQRYNYLAQKIRMDSAASAMGFHGQYLPYADSLQGSLSFLCKSQQLQNVNKLLTGEAQQTLNKVSQLQARILDAGDIEQYLQQRKMILQQYLSRYTHLPSGIKNAFQDYKKQMAYYSQQVDACKEMLNDPDKLLKTTLQMLNKLPAFNSFMQRNSWLPAIFGTSPGVTPSQSIPGLASRPQVLSAIQELPGAGGPAAGSMTQKQLGSAQGGIDQLRNKASAAGEIQGMPDFKPDGQRTRTFLQRLEFGMNLQSQRSTWYFPITTDIGLSAGYKLGHENVIGLGFSYKMGWGSNIGHIHVSSQGAGLRSFLDIHIKNTWFASGGFEYNYQQVIQSAAIFRNLQDWQQSGLLGISRIISMHTRFLKKAKMQVLWDFMSYRQVPRADPVKFRIGYSF